MPRTLVTFVAIAALVYIALCLVLFLAQRSFIYYPQARSAGDDRPTLTLSVDGERILVNTRPGPSANAVIYFGGNAENVSLSLPTLAAAFPERSIFAMNYRGYGGSSGKPSETGLITDALALFDRVHVDHPQIIVIGRSLGSGVAIHIASERPAERLVLITPYDSLLTIAAGQLGFFPLRWLMLDKFESWSYAAKITVPTLLIAAQNDEVIPFASTKSLYDQFRPSVASLTVIRDVDHNSISESPEYIRAVGRVP
jgi:pimeloyl-ACP methyl ester carboxylesterase